MSDKPPVSAAAPALDESRARKLALGECSRSTGKRLLLAGAGQMQIAKYAEKGQTRTQFNRVSTGGRDGTRSDAENQAHEAKNQETARRDSQAGEKAREAGYQDDHVRRRKDVIPLAVFESATGAPQRVATVIHWQSLLGATLAVAFPFPASPSALQPVMPICQGTNS